MKMIAVLLGLFLTVVYYAGTSHAQLNNKPFAFKGTSDGGVGMSMAGRQAILNQEVFGITPKNILRARDGSLLNVTEGKGSIPLVSYDQGALIPSYRGTANFRMNDSAGAGIFNAYFSPEQGSSSSYYGLTQAAALNTWTTQVSSNGGFVAYNPANSVDAWTSMVYTLN